MMPILNKIVKDIPEAMSIYVNQIVYDKKSRGERVYTYSLGEAFFDIPRFEIPDTDWYTGYHYSSSMGNGDLRKKISQMYKKYNVDVNPENEICISAGSKVLIFMVLQTILSSGNEVIVPEPAWLSYKEQIKLAGGKHIAVPYTKNVYDWENYITSNTKAIIINNPTNPSGKLFSNTEFEFLIQLAKKYNLFIICDEAYSDFLCPKDAFYSFAKFDKNKENTIIVNSLSKNMGMSGWRVGYVISHKDLVKQILKLNQHIVTCAPTVLQNYMAKHFEEILSYTRPQAIQMAEKRKRVLDIMNQIGIKAMDGVGTFYFLLDVSQFHGTTKELVYDLLINHNIATVPGAAYGESVDGFIRFGIGIENEETIQESLKLIKSFLDMPQYDNTKIKQQMKELGVQ